MVTIRPIGIIHSPYREPMGTPIQPAFADESIGEVVVHEDYSEGLADIEGFDRIWLLFWCHRSRPYRLRIVPYRDTVERGLFATRAPSRPNPIGMSAVRLLGRTGNRLKVSGLDVLDGTPLLDIKPYVPLFDSHPDSPAGWLERRRADREHADERFHAPKGNTEG